MSTSPASQVRQHAWYSTEAAQTYHDDTIESLLEPCNRILLLDPVREANPRLLLLPPRHTRAGATHHNVEVHPEDTDRGVVPRAEINVLLDAEPEVAGLGEVPALELVLLHFQTTLEDLLGLRSTDSDVYGDLFVATDAERTHGVTRLGGDGGLTGELLEHLGSPCQAIARLADADVFEKEKDMTE